MLPTISEAVPSLDGLDQGTVPYGPGNRSFEERIIADFAISSVVGMIAMSAASILLARRKRTGLLREHHAVIVTALGWTASSIYFAWRRLSEVRA